MVAIDQRGADRAVLMKKQGVLGAANAETDRVADERQHARQPAVATDEQDSRIFRAQIVSDREQEIRAGERVLFNGSGCERIPFRRVARGVRQGQDFGAHAERDLVRAHGFSAGDPMAGRACGNAFKPGGDRAAFQGLRSVLRLSLSGLSMRGEIPHWAVDGAHDPLAPALPVSGAGSRGAVA